MKRYSALRLIPLVLALLVLTGFDAWARKPEVIRHDAQYLDRQVSLNIEWQSTDPVVSIRVAAGREVKVIKVDAYDNKRVPQGYSGEVSVALQADPLINQDSIPYTIQLTDDVGQRSTLVTGKVAVPSAFAAPRVDDWGRDRVVGAGMPAAQQPDMIDKLRQVAQVLDAPPFLHDIVVTNPNTGIVTFSTKATDNLGLREINFRIFDSTNKQVDSQQISATGKLWQGTSKDFSLPPGNYKVIGQAIDSGGSTSPEKSAWFTIGTPQAAGPQPPQPPVEVPTVLTVTILPADVLAKGAQWQIPGGAWLNSADSVKAGLKAGWYDVTFKDVAGWKKPDTLKVSVEAGKTATATGTYTLDTSFSKTWTTSTDFETGTLVGVEDKTVPDQLQLSKSISTLPFIWVPNSNEGTISKVDSKTGTELGRYRTGPTTGGSPSRTTVDLKGNCWVGNRNTGTVVKVGLNENGQCVDRNKNGTIETSTGATPLAWGADECVLHEVVLIAGSEGTYNPGEYKGSYSGTPGPRGIGIDANNNLWAGTYGTHKYYHVDGGTGRILKTYDVPGHNPYGAVVDPRGIVWSADLSNSYVGRLDPASGAFTTIKTGQTYGMGMDKNNHLFIAGWCANTLTRVNTTTGAIEWQKPTGDSCSRGVALTNDGDVWVANSSSNNVSRWSNDGVKKTTISGFNHPTGVATDSDGKVWVVNYGDAFIKRIDPATNRVDLEKQVAGPHYGYSDMTGIVARSVTTMIGTWTAGYDAKSDAAKWKAVAWTGTEPAGTTVKVKVRSSKDGKTWSAWEDAVKGADLKATPQGRYVQVEVTLQIQSGTTSPVLSDLTVQGL
ncbi:MAG TPA: hypothetical protein PLO63_02480 [Syntrophales bacterium]|nr:hypothetical protein [Syntrophales bacterium]